MEWSTILLIIGGIGLLIVIPAVIAYINGYFTPDTTSQGRELEIKATAGGGESNPNTSGKLPGNKSNTALDILSFFSPPIFIARKILGY